jgi:23S rRNA pseudouridine1911/1915/1917 synthase
MRLEITHPATGDRASFSSTYPADLQHALDVLRD